MPRHIDALTAATLKHLRESWWDAAFTKFLRDTLQPRAGERILDVGCGTGTAEVSLGLLGLSQVRLFAVDLLASRVAQAVAEDGLKRVVAPDLSRSASILSHSRMPQDQSRIRRRAAPVQRSRPKPATP